MFGSWSDVTIGACIFFIFFRNDSCKGLNGNGLNNGKLFDLLFGFVRRIFFSCLSFDPEEYRSFSVVFIDERECVRERELGEGSLLEGKTGKVKIDILME